MPVAILQSARPEAREAPGASEDSRIRQERAGFRFNCLEGEAEIDAEARQIGRAWRSCLHGFAGQAAIEKIHGALGAMRIMRIVRDHADGCAAAMQLAE